MFWCQQNLTLNVHGAQEPIPLYQWATRHKRRPSTVMADRREGARNRERERTDKRPSLIDTVGRLDERLRGYRWPTTHLRLRGLPRPA